MSPMKTMLFMLAAGCALLLSAGEKYSAIYFSDSHLGPESCYNMSKDNPFRTKKDIKRDDATREYFNAMLKHIADHKGDNAKLIISGGDLIEGGTYGEEVHAKTLQNAIDRISRGTGLPFFFTNGNHDAWGVGGAAAFDKVARAYLAKQPYAVTFAKDKGINYSFELGGDLYVFGDFFTKKSHWIETILERISQAKPGQYRYIIVVTHPGMLGCGKTTRRVVEAAAKTAAKGGVILCGHSHRNKILKFESPLGKVSELMMATMVLGNTRDAFANPRDKMEVYWAACDQSLQLAVKKAKTEKAKVAAQGNLKKGEEIKSYYGPYLKEYFEVSGNGYAKLDISDDGITVTLQSAQLEQAPIVKTLF